MRNLVVDFTSIKNGVYLVDEFYADDLHIYDYEGIEYGVNDKLRFTFTLASDITRSPFMKPYPAVNKKGEFVINEVPTLYGSFKHLKIECVEIVADRLGFISVLLFHYK